jgi:two-component system LytT family sensor kinase
LLRRWPVWLEIRQALFWLAGCCFGRGGMQGISSYFRKMKAWLTRVFAGRYVFHLIVWMVYGLYLLLSVEDYIRRGGWLFTLAPLAISFVLLAALIYANVYVLVPKMLDAGRIGLYLLCVLLLIGLNTYLKSLTQEYYDALVWPKEPMEISSYFKWNFINSLWSILVSTLLLYSLRWSDQKGRLKNIEVEQLQTELKYLRSQINPHFLFNGLNTIYGNIDIRDQRARDVLLQFASLLRYSLYEADTDLVSLKEEAAYIENYVALQKARGNINLQTRIEIEVEDGEVKIAPLLFLPFLENAFKFSAGDNDTESSIAIRLDQKNGRVFFRCVNTVNQESVSGGGIGLTNVQRRLALLYGSRYSLEVRRIEQSYRVQLEIII